MAADVWALGGTLYMLKVGRPPFLAKKIMELCFKIIHEGVAWPGAAGGAELGGGALEPGVQRLLDGMLQKDPRARWTLAQVKRMYRHLL